MPRSGTRITAPQLEVKAIAMSRGEHPVTALRLLLDGRPYRGQGGVAAVASPRPGEVRQSWTVALEPGEHTIVVQAESKVSQALSPPVAVTYKSEEPVDVRPNLYVLAIGISAYPGDLRLNYAAHDAEAIADAFRTKSSALFQKVEARRLTDAGATRQAILAGLTWLRKQMTQRDIAIMFYSGHGLRDTEGSLFLLPVDGDPDDLLASSVSDDQVKKALAGLPGRVIALLDACHTGASAATAARGSADSPTTSSATSSPTITAWSSWPAPRDARNRRRTTPTAAAPSPSHSLRASPAKPTSTRTASST